MNGQVNPVEQDVDPNSTLGRKELISMLKQRYGNEMDGFKMSDVTEKERIREKKHRERDLRHAQQMVPDNREMNQHGGVHHSPAMNGNWDHFSGTGSEGSDESFPMGTQRRYVTHGISSKHTIVRRSDSEDDGSKDGSTERLQIPPASTFNSSENMIRSKGVVFLQYIDDVKRVNLPAIVTSVDTIKALFVNSFPDRIRMQDFEDGVKIVYIKDFETGTYYMLEDINEVLNHCFLKIQEKHPSVQSRIKAQLTNMEAFGISDYTAIPKTFARKTLFDESLPTDSHCTPAVSRNACSNKTTYHTQNNKSHIHTLAPNGTIHTHQPNNIDQSPIKTSTCHDHTQDVTNQLPGSSNNQKSHASPKQNPMYVKRRGEDTDTAATATNIGVDNDYRVYNSYNKKSEATTTDELRVPVIKVRANSYNSSTSKTESVEDQLDDLTELLKCALDDEEQHHQEVMECVNTKNPGKLNPNLVQNIQRETQSLARRNTLPKHFTPTIMVAAQQESDRRTSEPLKMLPKYNDHTSDRTDYGNSEVEGTRTSPVNTQLEAKKSDSQLELESAQEGDISLTSEGNPVAAVVETSMMSDILMDQIMDMELEVKARSSLALRHNEHSSSGSLCSKSCSNEKVNTFEDQPKEKHLSFIQQPVESHYTDMNGIYIREESDVTGKCDLVSKFEDDKEDEIFTSNEIVDKTVANGPSMQHIYASISKVTELPTRSKITTTFSNTNVQKEALERSSIHERACHRASVTASDFNELEDSAKCVHMSLQQLRHDLVDLRKSHTDGAKSFKADIQKKLLEFRKKASRVDEVLQQKLDINNKIIFADKHPVRERRHRLTEDQLSYNKKMSNTELCLNFLEGDMENVRISVVNKKCVENPDKLNELHEELTRLTKGLAEIKNRFHGLHDMLNVVIPDELKIISNEERFLMEEPEKLDGLIGRCKVLSGTLFTLERLASVQLEHRETQKPHQQPKQQQQQQQQEHSQPHSQPKTTRTSSISSNYTKSSTPKTAASYNYNQCAPFNDVFDIEDLKGKRNVRLNHKK